MVFVLIISITGFLLAWKSELQLKPVSQKAVQNSSTLIPIEQIQENATAYIDSLQLATIIDRIDYRPAKGIAKVRFDEHFTELQIDCYTGKVLSAKQRTDSIIEKIHDGSIFDFLFKNDSTPIKLFYSTIISLGLILICISGILLWRNPKKIKKIKTTENH